MKDKTMVIGYFNNNLGDDLFIKILLDKYPENKFILIGNSIYLETFNMYKNLKIINMDKIGLKSFRYICRKIKRMDIFYRILSMRCRRNVYIGGSLFIESDDVEEQCRYYKDLISNGKKSYLYGCNFGPYNTNYFFNFFKMYLRNFEDICFREEYSYELFKNEDNVRYAPDIVFNLDNPSVIKRNKKIVISVKKLSDEKMNNLYINKMIEITKHLIENGYEICFMSFCKKEGDEITIENIVSNLSKKYRENIEEYYYSNNMEEALKKINDATYVIGTRYHAMIIGFLFNKITIPIIYNVKMTNILNDINYEGLVFDINCMEDMSGEKIINYFLEPQNIDLSNIKDLSKGCFKKLDYELLDK